MKIAAAYLRVSDERQDEYSLDSQLKLIRDFAGKNDYIIPEEFVFVDDGISGRSAKKRTQFQNMIGWAKEKDRPFETILVWKFSRFARNQEESIFYKSMLQRCGVDVVSISEPLAEGPFGSLIERILEWMDEFYSIRLSAEVKRGMKEKVSRGEPVSIPAFGYDLVDKRYVPNSDADTVRQIFSAYLNDTGMVTIARQLAALGVRTRRGNPPENRFIEYILHNPVYIGKIRWSTEGRAASRRAWDDPNIVLVDGQHEPIISMELWNAVQEKLARAERGHIRYSRTDQKIDWMLKGLVKCSNCGATLTMMAAAESMQCHKYAHGLCAISHSLSIRKANKLVISALENAVALGNFPVAPNPKAEDKPTVNYDKLINMEMAKLHRVQEAYEAGIDTLAEYADKKAKIAARIADLHAQASAETRHKPIDMNTYRKKVISVLDIVKNPDVPEVSKNAALHSIISYIVYEKEHGRLAIYFYQ